MNKELKKFMRNNCRKCDEPCEKGIVETKDFIKCIDKNIAKRKDYFMISREEVANLAIKYRAENNLNQQDLAKKLNISNKTLCHIENENEKVRKITLQKVFIKLKNNNL